jgi:hypothetical protein
MMALLFWPSQLISNYTNGNPQAKRRSAPVNLSNSAENRPLGAIEGDCSRFEPKKRNPTNAEFFNA